MAYASEDSIEKYLGININVALASFLAILQEAVDDYIDEVCGGGIVAKRWFDAADTDTTRYYDGNDATVLEIDDLRSLTSLTVHDVALTANTDFYLYPLNAIADSKPYTQIQLIQPETLINAPSRAIALRGVDPFVFTTGQKAITIVGKFGYSLTPPALVQVAAMKMVAAIIKENISDADLKEVSAESLGEYSVTYAKISEVANKLGIADMLAPLTRKSASSGKLSSTRLAS